MFGGRQRTYNRVMIMTNKDTEIVKEEMARLKQKADEYPLIGTESKPHDRHWATLPGDIRVCLTKQDDGEYHLSVSASWGRVHDVIIYALFEMIEAPEEIRETPPISNENIRHFWWKYEEPVH